MLENIMYWDLTTYLPNQVLTKVDRASMAASLECRLPFLDPRLVALAWKIPSRLKIRNGQGKWILRKVVHRYVPHTLLDRPKQGFTVPIGAWLHGPLRDWANDLLSETSIRSTGLLSAKQVARLWTSFVNGSNANPNALWSILMLQAWARMNLET
jgi:asparagine synthase (glutamine-hydrolysing)